jgi:hypothetical protein
MSESLVAEPVVIDKLAFEQSERGYTIRAFYLLASAENALVHIRKDKVLIRRFMFPAYKIWNLASRFSDIVDAEIEGNADGFAVDSWWGI